MTTIRNQFPDFNLGDKVDVGGGGIVREDTGAAKMGLRVYYRKKYKNKTYLLGCK